MFTGLIEETGIVRTIRKKADGMEIRFAADRILDDLFVDNSVAVDGICQTVTETHRDGFSVFAMTETLKKTTIGKWRPGRHVNLERALRTTDRLGGHLVQGHVDCVAQVQQVVRNANTWLITFRIPGDWAHLVVLHGSICVNGVSLTVARKAGTLITVSIIPFTLKSTNLQELTRGDNLNIETDVIGKYLYHFSGKESE